MSISTDVIYDKETHRIIAVRYDEVWVLPKDMGLAQFRNGSEPVLFHNDKGELFYEPNVLILNNKEDNESE